jgi:hypothetical protein
MEAILIGLGGSFDMDFFKKTLRNSSLTSTSLKILNGIIFEYDESFLVITSFFTSPLQTLSKKITKRLSKLIKSIFEEVPV